MLSIFMSRPVSRVCLLMLASVCLQNLSAAEGDGPGLEVDPEVVIAYRGEVVLTQLELDASFSKLPEAERLVFIRDGAKVNQLIRALLKRKVVAAEAGKAGFEQDPLIASRMTLAAQKELVEAWLQNLVEQAPEADYETLAREHFLVNRESYRMPVALDVSHILLGTETRSRAEAEALATELESRLQQDPGRFDELVMEFSDDPAKSVNGGRYPDMQRGQMVASFERVAFSLEQDGQISEPVKTEHGYHIIRLNRRKGGELQEFDDVRKQAVESARKRYLRDYRERYLRKVLADPVVIPEGAVEIMAKRHFGENLELAPNYQQ